ncbi:calcium-binding protein [Nostoc sp.]|uniref:calcium-binding protein n=1 Tax=Nostoc sp. TaxID=1180 RepID=UPI002FFA5218
MLSIKDIEIQNIPLSAATNDTLEGTSVADTLIGGKGDDFLNGKGGADIYRYALGDGNDILYDTEYRGGNIDQLIFSGSGLTASNAIVTRLGSRDDLKISFGGVTGSVTLKEQVDGTYDYGVEKITFSNGTIWNEAQLRNAYLTLGAATNDTLEGTSVADTLIGGKGDDFLNGKGGADIYRYALGDGNDILYDTEYRGGNIDQLIFSGSGLTASNAIVTRLGSRDDLKISFGGVTGSVTLKEQVDGTYDYGVEKITFSNGTIWNEAQLRNAYLTLGA